jgi:dTDP-4-dehydrorhamnose 3,5-epimerase-like enzyme
MHNIEKVKWINLNSVSDERGSLTAVEGGTDIPFSIKRIFYVHDTVTDRGGHAHRATQQVLIAISGSLTVRFTDKHNSKEYKLNDPAMGLYMPPMLFVELMDFSKDGVCLVLADTHYDIKESIRSKSNFYAELSVDAQ